ncbi:DNA polymerase III subunit gamma/tau [Hazenella coriacea]|uniref:DNA-directed DNA polymerase n=1 Tax=Hazenella coriacea TaxID=1179467 RepID=A0A4R3L8F3_9BACL|nr:DNA polymerase III subunit gamma/tau [Hazenella coriacea]TCS95438.1 DNA polymerase-3 subunit gamma/tau [Hazenella coriacea]
MSYRALYRVWRSQRFSDLIGQEHVTQTLMNALKEGHLSHAYLFNGPRGTGKTSAAKILAKAVNCERGPAAEPCNECEACQRITDGRIMDVVEIDAASNRGVDEIRELRDKVKYAPTEVRYKVYIIDEVHMLTTEAFNALLKTLEEPPAHVIFILATTEPHKLPPTIISRCQRFAFRRISVERIVDRLKMICESQQVHADEKALYTVARAADGGMRDALSLLDQALAFGKDHIDESTVLAVTGAISRDVLYLMIKAMAEGDSAAALQHLDDCVMGGLEPDQLIQDLTFALRDLLLKKTAPRLEYTQAVFTDESDMNMGELFSVPKLTRMLDTLIHYQQQMKWVAHPRILLEMAMVHLCEPPIESQTEEASQVIRQLQEQIRSLEEKVEQLHLTPRPIAEKIQKPVQETQPARSSSRKLLLQDRFLEQLSSERLAEVKRVWSDILHRIKEEKITVHAWLMDGEPVGATNDTVLVAFKSKIHRETTEKEAHKSLIEQVMGKFLGRPMALYTLMHSDWGQVETKKAPDQMPSTESEPIKKDSEEIVRKAIELFGENLVEVSDRHN